LIDEIAEVEPLAPFQRWLDEAWQDEPDAHAMILATTTSEGRPSARAVLLKGLDDRGFVFYTNLESRKSKELLTNPHAALCFMWKSLNRQVRIEGGGGAGRGRGGRCLFREPAAPAILVGVSGRPAVHRILAGEAVSAA